MAKRKKSYFANAITSTEIYKDLVADEPRNSRLRIGASQYRSICDAVNKKIMDGILEKSYCFNIPYRLGALRILKKETNLDRLAVDFNATKKAGCTVYHLNEHSNGFRYNFYWKKRDYKFSFNSLYMFVATRTNKRRLAAIIKEGSADYFRFK